jgi:hypothetical protein
MRSVTAEPAVIQARDNEQGPETADPVATALNAMPPPHSNWKILVRSQIVGAKAELDRLAGPARERNDTEAKRFDREASDHLVEACRILARRGFKRNLRPGSEIDSAFKHVHTAESMLSHLTSCEELQAQGPYLVAKARRILPAGPRRAAIERLVSPERRPRPCRLEFAQARQTLYEISDQRYTQLRRFRNNLVVAGVLLCTVVAFLILIGTRAPASLPLCFESHTETGVMRACPTSQHRGAIDANSSAGSIVTGSRTADGLPSDDDVIAVALLGVAGGALSGALAVKRLRPAPETPYNLPLYSFLFKLPAGALTALGGLILVGGQVVPGLSALDSQGQILAYALLFGAAQQGLTRYIDARASEVLDAIPTKANGKSPAAAGSP